ncbi:MAG TPA: hypothetical protein VGF45_13630 [Polyangia bacterium]
MSFAAKTWPRLASHAKRTAVAGALALFGVVGAGCEEDVNYGYVAVKVTIADTATPDYRARISACGVNVEGADSDFTSLGCQMGRVSTNDLGTFEWSTNETGVVRFVVRLTDITGTEIGKGTSSDVAIVPGQMINAAVVVTPAEAALQPRM